MASSFEEHHQPRGRKLFTLNFFYLEGEAIHLNQAINLGDEFAFPGYWVSAIVNTCKVFDPLTFGLR